MEKTGMTRRIDELGRIVIPKEIRKNLKIKDNDQVEISVVDNRIVLKKHDNLNKDQVISTLIKSLKRTINHNIILTSRDKIVDYSLINKEKLDDLSINDELMNIIENRKELVNLVKKDILYSVFPIVVNGDLYGSLIINGNDDINNRDIEIIKYSKMFLENYLE